MFKTPPPVTVNTKKPVPPFILTTSHKDPHPIYRDHYRQGTRGMLPHMASVSYTPHGSTAESPTPLTPSPMVCRKLIMIITYYKLGEWCWKKEPALQVQTVDLKKRTELCYAPIIGNHRQSV